MDLELIRFISQDKLTIGALYSTHQGAHDYLCFTLEDQWRPPGVKVAGETRIPAGRYAVELRTIGGYHQRYGARFPAMHKGMLHVRNVPGFEYILIHCGNTADDSAGCILVGDTAMPRVGQIGGSEVAYRRIYPPIVSSLLKGDDVWLKVVDL
jgi:hypothetical protein